MQDFKKMKIQSIRQGIGFVQYLMHYQVLINFELKIRILTQKTESISQLIFVNVIQILKKTANLIRI